MRRASITKSHQKIQGLPWEPSSPPGPGEILVRVQACGLDQVEHALSTGAMSLLSAPPAAPTSPDSRASRSPPNPETSPRSPSTRSTPRQPLETAHVYRLDRAGKTLPASRDPAAQPALAPDRQ